ncbi:MAG TPA: hypothetical protein PKW05_13950, partial [Anaerolineae bacterium]|nr:hypothetical protein [Anaerolineae bacterium]
RTSTPAAALGKSPSAPALIRGPGRPVHLLDAGARRWTPNSQTLEAMGYRCQDVAELAWQELLFYPVEDPLPVAAWAIGEGTLVRGTSPDVYLIA